MHAGMHTLFSLLGLCASSFFFFSRTAARERPVVFRTGHYIYIAQRPSAQWLCSAPNSRFTTPPWWKPLFSPSKKRDPHTEKAANQRREATRSRGKAGFASRARLTPKHAGQLFYQVFMGSPSSIQGNTSNKKLYEVTQPKIKLFLFSARRLRDESREPSLDISPM